MTRFAELLEAHPPTPANRPERRRLLETINPIYRNRVDMGAGYVPLIEYYRARVDKVICELRTIPVVAGVRIWKLHSSGFVIKTPRTVFAIDLIDSVVRSGKSNDLCVDPEIWDRPCEQTPATMSMTAAQRRALAELIEYAFYTHQHRDHISWDLPRLIIEAGHEVIVTAAIQSAWAGYGFAQRLRVPGHMDALREPPDLHRCGPLHVRVHAGYQVHSRGRVTPCNAYLITTADGLDILSKGDGSDTSLYGWLLRAKRFGAKVDLYVGNVSLDGNTEAIARTFDCFMVPGHDWDMIHTRATRGDYWWQVGPWGGVYDQLDWHFVRDRAELLTWGESLSVPPPGGASGNALHLAESGPEVPGFDVDGVRGYLGRNADRDEATGSEWRWRGRTLQATPPSAWTGSASVFGIYPLNLCDAGAGSRLHIGYALAPQASAKLPGIPVLRIHVGDGWGTEARLLLEIPCITQEPEQTTVPLGACTGKDAHLILEVATREAAAGPAWILDPCVVRDEDGCG